MKPEDPETKIFESLGDGNQRLNMGKVYSLTLQAT